MIEFSNFFLNSYCCVVGALHGHKCLADLNKQHVQLGIKVKKLSQRKKAENN